jgi:hypothetical protein
MRIQPKYYSSRLRRWPNWNCIVPELCTSFPPQLLPSFDFPSHHCRHHFRLFPTTLHLLTPCRRTYPKFIAICSVESARPCLSLRIPNFRSLGNDNRVMFATLPSHVHQAHNPHYNPPVSNPPNGLAHLPNGNDTQNTHHQQPPPPAQSHRPTPPAVSKEPINVVGIPSVSVQTDRLIVGNSESRQCSLRFSSVSYLTNSQGSARSYTPLKVLGDGSFGTVWLCDWHGTLPPNTPLSPMQCGAGARPEWAGKRLVAVKRMKKKWEGGWDECKKLKELEVSKSFHALPCHKLSITSVTACNHFSL